MDFLLNVCHLDVFALTEDGESAVHIAARRDELTALKWLQAKGFDLMEPDDTGRTPLQHAPRFPGNARTYLQDHVISTLGRNLAKIRTEIKRLESFHETDPGDGAVTLKLAKARGEAKRTNEALLVEKERGRREVLHAREAAWGDDNETEGGGGRYKEDSGIKVRDSASTVD